MFNDIFFVITSAFGPLATLIVTLKSPEAGIIVTVTQMIAIGFILIKEVEKND